MKHSFLLIAFLLGSASFSALASSENPRIIGLAPHIVEMLYSIGAGDQIIGTTDHSDYPEQAKSIPRIGNYARLQIEKILAMQPDLVIAWKSGNPSDDLQRLEKLGLKIVYSQPNSLDDVAKELRLFGEITKHQQQSEQVALNYENRLAALKVRYADRKPVSIFYELWPQPLTTIAGNAWPQQVAALCQVKNPFVEAVNDYPQIGLEQVIQANPEIIIQPRTNNVAHKDAINWQNWSEISAVKRNAIIHPDENKLHRMTPRVLAEAERLCHQIDQYRQ